MEWFCHTYIAAWTFEMNIQQQSICNSRVRASRNKSKLEIIVIKCFRSSSDCYSSFIVFPRLDKVWCRYTSLDLAADKSDYRTIRIASLVKDQIIHHIFIALAYISQLQTENSCTIGIIHVA